MGLARTGPSTPSTPVVLGRLCAFGLKARAQWLRRLCRPRAVSLLQVLPRVRTYTLDAPGTALEHFGIARPARTDHPWVARCPGRLHR